MNAAAEGAIRKAYKAAYYAAHKEESRSRNAAWRASHKEECKARSAAYYATHREEMRAYNAKYRIAYDAAHKGDRAAAHRLRTYGIDADSVSAMLDAGGGLCAICRKKAAKCVDHNHATGRVRGMLCVRCNASLGILENAEWVSLARKYILLNDTN